MADIERRIGREEIVIYVTLTLSIVFSFLAGWMLFQDFFTGFLFAIISVLFFALRVRSGHLIAAYQELLELKP